MHQNPGPFDVPQELVSQPHAIVGPFDQARDVRQHERPVDVDLHAAQMRNLGGERIVGDLGACMRQSDSTACFFRRWACRPSRHRR